MSSGGRNRQNPEQPGAIPESGDEQASHEVRHRYARHRDENEDSCKAATMAACADPTARTRTM